MALRPFHAEFRGIGNCVDVFVEGRQAGNRLNDNAHKDDHYRYRDALHFSLYVIAHYSPCTAQMVFGDTQQWSDRDRRSEEVAVLMAFAAARKFGQLWEMVPAQVVCACLLGGVSAPGYRHAMETGMSLMEKLASNGGGLLHVDPDSRSATYSEAGGE